MKRNIFIFVLLGMVFVFNGCFGGEDVSDENGQGELISRWENDVQPEKEMAEEDFKLLKRGKGEEFKISKVEGEYSLENPTDKSGGYIARAKVYKTGQVNAMPYDLSWEARTGKPVSNGTTSKKELTTSADEFVDMFFVGDEYVKDEDVLAFFVGDLSQ